MTSGPGTSLTPDRQRPSPMRTAAKALLQAQFVALPLRFLQRKIAMPLGTSKFDMFKEIYRGRLRDYGLLSFWKQPTFIFARFNLMSGAILSLRGPLRERYAPYFSDSALDSFRLSAAVGASLGITLNLLASPLTVAQMNVRVFHPNREAYQTIWSALTGIAKEEGILKLFKNAPALLVEAAVYRGFQLGAFDSWRSGVGSSFGSLVVGAFGATYVATLLAQPLYLLRRFRYNMVDEPWKETFRTVSKHISAQGFKPFFTGCFRQVAYSPTFPLALALYEYYQYK